MTGSPMVAVAEALEARQDLEGQDRSATDKIMSAADAIARYVKDDDVIGVGGTNHARTPMALLLEILRQGRTGLALVRPLTCYECEFFIATGMADRIVTSWVGVGHGWGLARVVREFVEAGKMTFEEWSHLGIGLRYKAGAMGVPFLPTFSMMGSDLAARLELEQVRCPYTGQMMSAVPSLNPDVALIHVQRADCQGNAVVDGYELMDADVAHAARRLVISAEEIVSTDQLRADPSRTLIPGFAVDAVVEQPYGAYPHECYGRYEADRDAMECYMAAVRDGGADGARRYVEELVRSYPDFDAYVASVGQERLARLRAEAEELLPR